MLIHFQLLFPHLIFGFKTRSYYRLHVILGGAGYAILGDVKAEIELTSCVVKVWLGLDAYLLGFFGAFFFYASMYNFQVSAMLRFSHEGTLPCKNDLFLLLILQCLL